MSRDISRDRGFVQADDLALQVYRLSRALPSGERFGFLHQLRRASMSVPVNLVEGAERTTARDFSRFVEIASGSAAEARYLLSLCRRAQLLDPKSCAQLEEAYSQLLRSLNALRQALTEPARRASPALKAGSR